MSVNETAPELLSPITVLENEAMIVDEPVWEEIGEVNVYEYDGAPTETEGRASCLRALNTAAIRHMGPVDIAHAVNFGDIGITGPTGTASASGHGSVFVDGTCRELIAKDHGRASATEVTDSMEADGEAIVRGHGSPKSVRASLHAKAVLEGNPEAAFAETYGEVIIFGEPGRIETDIHGDMKIVTLNPEYEPVVDRDNGMLLVIKPGTDYTIDDWAREANWPLFKHLQNLFPDEYDDPRFCAYASVLGYSNE